MPWSSKYKQADWAAQNKDRIAASNHRYYLKRKLAAQQARKRVEHS